MPICAGFDHDQIVPIAEACGALLREDDGLDNMLAIIKAALPPRLYETLYACAVEVAAAEWHVEQEELLFLQMLRDELEIDDLIVAAIERSARVRYRVK